MLIPQGRWGDGLTAAAIAVGASLVFAASYIAVNMLFVPPEHGLLHTLCIWDCRWYASIAERGYDSIPDMRRGAEQSPQSRRDRRAQMRNRTDAVRMQGYGAR